MKHPIYTILAMLSCAYLSTATLEALIVSFVDDLDAKVNMVALKAMDPQNGEAFTDKIFALENRKFYRGLRDAGRGEPVS